MTFLIVDPQNSNRLFAASGSKIWKSTDAGAIWVAAAGFGLSEFPGFNRPLALAVDPQNTDTLYIVMLNQYHAYPSGRCCGQPGTLFRSADAGEHWTEIGSGLDGASFDPMDGCTCNSTNVGLVVDPFQSNTVYVGANGDGVFKTVDGGATWTASNSGLKAIGASRVTIDARDPGTIYALTSNRIYKSLDSGSTWSPGPWGVPDVNLSGAFAPSLQSPDTLYAGSFGLGDGYPAESGKILKSVDSGATWQDASLELDWWGSVWDFAIDPHDPLTAYAGTDGGVLKTMDGGANWVLATLPNISGTYAIAVDPKNPGTIFAGAWSTAPLYKSTDGGASWTAASAGLPKRPPYSWVVALALDPQETNVVYAGLSGEEAGVFKSADGGATWSRSSLGLAPQTGSVTSLVINPLDTSVLYASTDQGLFRSVDGAVNWTEVGGSSEPGLISSLTIDLSASNKLYAAGSGGVFLIDLSQDVRPARSRNGSSGSSPR